MERQLVLLDPQPEWRLDEATKAIGRAGIAEARKALQQAKARATATTGQVAA